MEISQPPPRVSPAGAVTTGLERYFIRILASWRPETIASRISQSPIWMRSRTLKMLAPAEKLAPWFPTTRPMKSFSTTSQLLLISSMIISSRAFIFVWNSKQATPSPISTNVALGLVAITILRSFREGKRMIRGFSPIFT